MTRLGWSAEEHRLLPAPYGRIYADTFLTDGTSTGSAGLEELSAALWLGLRPEFTESWAANVLLTTSYESSLSSGFANPSGVSAGAREGYVVFSRNGFEERVGQQIIAWGNGDGYNPTDFLTARNDTFLRFDDELRRSGALSAMTSWTPADGSSPLNFTLVWTPWFAQSRQLVVPGLIPPGVIVEDAQFTASSIADTELAAKISYLSPDGWDFAVEAFTGWNHEPELGSPIISQSGILINQVFHRRKALGAEGSWSTGKWIFRADIAFNLTENPDGSNPLIQPSNLDSIAGVERPIGSRARIIAQYIFRYYPYWSLPQTPVATANSILMNYPSQARNATSLRVSYDLQKSASHTLGLEFSGAINLDQGDFFLRPALKFNGSNGFGIVLGWNKYYGPALTPFGALEPLSAGFLEASYLF